MTLLTMNRFTYFHSLAIATVMLSFTGCLVFSAHRQAQLSRARTLREDGNRIETG